MVWAAFDRAVRAVERHGLPGDVDTWREVRDRVRDEVMTEGYDADRNTFTQHYATQEVDASLLMLPLIGFIDGQDPRMLGTIEAIEQDLMREGLLMRYRTQTGVDGLAGQEHPFLACSFWLVSAYVEAGRVARRTRPLRPAGRADQRRRPPRGGVRPARTSGWSGTSRRPSATSRWCRRRSGCGKSPTDRLLRVAVGDRERGRADARPGHAVTEVEHPDCLRAGPGERPQGRARVPVDQRSDGELLAADQELHRAGGRAPGRRRP